MSFILSLLSFIRKVYITGNLNIAKDNVDFGSNIGGLVGLLCESDDLCEISNCCVDSPDGSVKGSYQVGGLVGSVTGKAKITNSYARVNLQGTSRYLGGLIGIVYGNYDTSIENCYSDCQMSVSANSYADNLGGLIGCLGQDTTINNCYSSGSIFIDINCDNSNDNYASDIGTFVGQRKNSTQINYSFSTVNISVGNSYAHNPSNDSSYNPDADTPLWYYYDNGLGTGEYVYNYDGTNHCNSGYKASLNWNPAYWFNLTGGGFPKLIGLPNR